MELFLHYLLKIWNLTSWEKTQPQMLTQRRKMSIQNFLNIRNIQEYISLISKATLKFYYGAWTLEIRAANTCKFFKYLIQNFHIKQLHAKI